MYPLLVRVGNSIEVVLVVEVDEYFAVIVDVTPSLDGYVYVPSPVVEDKFPENPLLFVHSLNVYFTVVVFVDFCVVIAP